LRIVGPSVTPLERRHRDELRELAQSCAPGAVRLDGGVTPAEVAGLLRNADVLVNATEPGSADKVVFEAMAAGRPVIASSPAFDPLLGDTALPLTFADRDVDALAARISTLAWSPTDEVERVTRELRRRIEDEHSLENWATNVVDLATELSERRSLSRLGGG
jgi:glycosyltransferase involved in cell wall biosynthesis